MKREARKALDEIGINIPRIDVPVARLSGGQRQAIAVARTISGDADIILLDEPLAAMGAKEGAMILDLIQRLKDEGNVSIIMILHNYVHVLTACDRVNLIQDGVIALDKPTAETSVEELTDIVVEEYRRARLAAQADMAPPRRERGRRPGPASKSGVPDDTGDSRAAEPPSDPHPEPPPSSSDTDRSRRRARSSARVCTIGVDFGTESGRALLLDARSGEQLGSASSPSQRGDRLRAPVNGRALAARLGAPGPRRLGRGPRARRSPMSSRRLASRRPRWSGSASTSPPARCCRSPMTGSLVSRRALARRRHAWPKLWKHHAAQPVADRLNEVAHEREESFLSRYGGRISSEWYFPKLIELWLEDRDVYDAASTFIEATDWIVWWLTGRPLRQSCTAAYKAMWSATEGLPATAYFEAAYPGFPIRAPSSAPSSWTLEPGPGRSPPSGPRAWG